MIFIDLANWGNRAAYSRSSPKKRRNPENPLKRGGKCLSTKGKGKGMSLCMFTAQGEAKVEA